jgi:hypothetical protein
MSINNNLSNNNSDNLSDNLSDNNSNNLSTSDNSNNSTKLKIRRNKKQFYAVQRNNIISQLISLAQFDHDNTILLIKLQHNHLLLHTLSLLSNDIKKFYKCATWGYFVSIANNQEGDLISLFKAVFKDHGYSIFSKNITSEYNSIKKRYVKLHFIL